MLDNSISQFATTFLIAFAAYWLVSFVRTVGFVPERWKREKPIICDVCMAFWCALFVAISLWVADFFLAAPAQGSTGARAILADAARHVFRFGGAVGVCYLMLRHAPPPASLPPL